uniref:Abundant larval transcript-2 protein n=1 Tax=Wuchereria bancrofti TaxID=6293 RepID=A0AAF5Q3A9_WUCBA
MFGCFPEGKNEQIASQKLMLIAFGLIIFTVTLPCMSQSNDESSGADDTNNNGDESGSEGGGGGGDEYVTKAEFVETDSKRKCTSHEACYDQREPQVWCRLNENQSWTDKGCFCDDKLHSCVIERKNSDKLEYSYCAPQESWQCS